MKRETYRHPKTYDLAARLQVDRPAALGRLELLWDYTGDVAPQGDIGKWPNAAIAAACDWSGNPDQFVEALVDAGWLDKVDEYRLVVHDWPDHCQEWVRKKLKRSRLAFLVYYAERKTDAGETPAGEDGADASEVATVSRQYPDRGETAAGPCLDVFRPIPSNPNPSEPNPSHGFGSDGVGVTPKTAPVAWDEPCRMASALCRELGQLPDGPSIATYSGGVRCLKAETPEDRAFILRLCVRIHQGVIPAKWLADATKSTLKAKPREPWTYLIRCIENMAAKAKPRIDLAKTLDAIAVPDHLLQPRPP